MKIIKIRISCTPLPLQVHIVDLERLYKTWDCQVNNQFPYEMENIHLEKTFISASKSNVSAKMAGLLNARTDILNKFRASLWNAKWYGLIYMKYSIFRAPTELN